MKKLRLLFCLLVVVCVIASSSTFSAMPQGKFPIQVISSRSNPNNYEKQLTSYLVKALNNSPNFRNSNGEENRIMLQIIISRYFPGVVSSDAFASSTPINTYSLVWLAKPKNKHAYYIWHDSGTFQTLENLTQYILKEANSIVLTIKEECPYVFQ
mgnify:CR=1 FL=1